MRLPLLSTQSLTPEQKTLYADMCDGIAKNFKGFTAINDAGQLIGPWNPWLSFPKFGGADVGAGQGAVDFARAAAARARGGDPGHGRQFHSAYELYAHVLAAELRGLPDEKISTIVAGQRPADLTEEEGIAYDLAANLIGGGALPALTYKRAVGAFGLEGAAEFIYLVGLYCAVSVALNGFDVPLPEDEA